MGQAEIAKLYLLPVGFVAEDLDKLERFFADVLEVVAVAVCCPTSFIGPLEKRKLEKKEGGGVCLLSRKDPAVAGLEVERF